MMKKEREIKKKIKPLCKMFNIKYEYFTFTEGLELLRLNNQAIECTGDTIQQILDKTIGYIFVEFYCKNNNIGAFQKQTLNVIKKDWVRIKESKDKGGQK